MKILIWLTHRDVPPWNFTNKNLKRLREKLPKSKYEIIVVDNKESFLQELKNATVAAVWSFEQEWLEIAGKLKMIITPAAGRDYFHVEPDDDIRLEYCTYHGRIMAETVVAMILAECRGIILCNNARQNKNWCRAECGKAMRTLRGSAVGILGFGNIGVWTGRLLKAFGVNITGIKRSVIEVPEYFDNGDRIEIIDNIETVLPGLEHLVICLPRSEQTDNLLDKKMLTLLPHGAAVYNIGRGNCIVEDDLAEVLEDGKLAAAYLDVFQEEPLSEKSRLWNLENVFIMPHASAIAPEYLDLFVDEFTEKLKVIDL